MNVIAGNNGPSQKERSRRRDWLAIGASVAIGLIMSGLSRQIDISFGTIWFWAMAVFAVLVLGFAFSDHAWRWPPIIVITMLAVDVGQMWLSGTEISPFYPVAILLFVPITIGLMVVAQIGAVTRRRIGVLR